LKAFFRLSFSTRDTARGGESDLCTCLFVFLDDTKLESNAIIHNIQIIKIRKKITPKNSSIIKIKIDCQVLILNKRHIEKGFCDKKN